MEDVPMDVPPVSQASPQAPVASQVPVAPPAIDPMLAQEIAMLKQRQAVADQMLGDYKLDKELADLRGRHGQMLQHFGPAVPEDFGALEPAVLQEYKAILEGNVAPHELAYMRALLNQALQGEGTLQDRILAAAAKNAPPVTPEGKGGGIPSNAPEPRKTYETTADRVAAVRNLFRSLSQAQPGS